MVGGHLQGSPVDSSPTSDSARPSSKQQRRREVEESRREVVEDRREVGHMSGRWTLSLDSGEKASD